MSLSQQQILLLKFWIPPLFCGAISWLLFLLLGETPLVRATGLALVIVGTTLALRRMGSVLAVVGGLTLALSPAFWQQTGGSAGDPATITIAMLAAAVTVILAIPLAKRRYIALGIGIAVFAVFFWSQIGTPRSIRLTGFVIAWLAFLLVDMLLITNPRPDAAPRLLEDRKKMANTHKPRPYHTLGILLLYGLGVLNDPLLTLLAAAIVLSLFLTQHSLPRWYWPALALVIGIGLRGIAVDYIDAQAYRLALGSWRDGREWLDFIQLIVSQFSIFGVILGVLGVARLARWYPPLGVVTLIAYTAYSYFALVYNGPDRNFLLLPLYLLQVVWMTYAVLAISEWVARVLRPPWFGRHLVIAVYGLLPLSMLWQQIATI